MDPMRITFVMPRRGFSGGAKVVAIYAKRLADRGHDVHVIWQRSRPALPHKRLMRRFTGKRPVQGEVYFDPIGIFQNVSRHWDRVQDHDVPDGDVVIATWWETAYSVTALAPAKGAKVYFVQHHEVHENLPVHFSAASYHLPLKKITISQWLVDTMAELYGDRDVALVENSVDLAQFHAPEREKNAAPTVGLLYSPSAYKGVDIALEAFARAKRQVPELKLVAFGKAEPQPSLPLPEGTHYERRPPQGRLRELYAMCDVWLCGSRSEGFHLPPLEAMACRTPVVSTRVGGAYDVVTEGVNGHVVDVGDAASLGDRLADVARLSPEAWRAMSDAAFARAQSWSWDDATDRLEALLAAEVDRARRAAPTQAIGA